jgi:hypothetical protein
MDAFLFDPKEKVIENLENQNIKTHNEIPITIYIIIASTIAMLAVLYKKSQTNITNLYDNLPENPFYLVVDRIKSQVLSFFFMKPVIQKNSIQVIRHSYELPKTLDFLFR